jgi:arabinan endo-1,5-alpha-L-arabinosidase
MANPPLRIIPGSSYTHLEHNTTRPNSEGAYQFRWVEQATGQNWYYLFFSSGACCNDPDKLEVPGEEYRMMVSKYEQTSSSSPSPTNTNSFLGLPIRNSHRKLQGPARQRLRDGERRHFDHGQPR